MAEELNTPEMQEITDDDKLWALLGYIFPLIALLGLLLEGKKDRAFIKYHAVHALLLAVVVIILSWTVCLWVLPWVYGIFLGVKAYQGEWVEVPFLTDMAKGQGWV